MYLAEIFILACKKLISEKSGTEKCSPIFYMSYSWLDFKTLTYIVPKM